MDLAEDGIDEFTDDDVAGSDATIRDKLDIEKNPDVRSADSRGGENRIRTIDILSGRLRSAARQRIMDAPNMRPWADRTSLSFLLRRRLHRSGILRARMEIKRDAASDEMIEL